jgi:hypothetical protein
MSKERETSAWVLLAYRLPREPSTPRITVWRKLKRLGVAQLLDGLVALPADAQNRKQLEWLADEIVAHEGAATIWIGSPVGALSERSVAAGMSEAIASEYRAIFDEAETGRVASEADRRRVVARLRRELQRIGKRDYFPPPERELARNAVRELAQLVEVTS